MSNFINHKPTKRLLLLWKPGQVLTSRALIELGLSHQRISYLKKTGVLETIGEGAFRKAIEHPTWMAAVEALQQQLKYFIHIGGSSALAIKGTSHYMPLGEPKIWIFGSSKIRLPKWFLTYKWSADIGLIHERLFNEQVAETLVPAILDNFTIIVSRRERAIMEAISLIGKYHRFEEVVELFEGLTSLDAEIVQKLLENCLSIKVKRIFLYMARESGHSWFLKLDEFKINLGSGKREVVKGGKLDSRYLITVPRVEDAIDV